MKNQLLSLFAIFIASMMSAQTGFNYKALITDNGSALANQSVNIKFTILVSGTTAVYQETQTATTDANGIVSTNIGEGTSVSGDFNTINWATDQSLKVEIDTGSGYQDYGTNPLKYVPAAKYADTAGNVFNGDFNDLSNKPDVFKVDDGSGNTATAYTENIKHRGNVFLGEAFSPFGVGKSTLRINRMVNDVDSYGITSTISGTGTGFHYGIVNQLVGTGTGNQYGTINNIDNTGSGVQFGTRNRISNTGSGIHYGSSNHLGGTGTGTQFGTKNTISNTGLGNHYGNYNYLGGTGTGSQFGTRNDIYNDGSGTHYGNYNLLAGNGTGVQYGTKNTISNTGSGNHYGNYNRLGGTGTGVQYGTYTYLTGSGSGDKYGTYAKIKSTAGGTHYAIYGETEKAGSYAGYFKGDVKVTKKITAPTSGTADMKAYVYGSITSNGNKRSVGSSDGYTVNRTSPGEYEVIFDTAMANTYGYTAIATISDGIGFIRTVHASITKMIIYTDDSSGNPANKAFDFVVYKK